MPNDDGIVVCSLSSVPEFLREVKVLWEAMTGKENYTEHAKR
jgi:hypothetical protein